MKNVYDTVKSGHLSKEEADHVMHVRAVHPRVKDHILRGAKATAAVEGQMGNENEGNGETSLAGLLNGGNKY